MYKTIFTDCISFVTCCLVNQCSYFPRQLLGFFSSLEVLSFVNHHVLSQYSLYFHMIRFIFALHVVQTWLKICNINSCIHFFIVKPLKWFEGCTLKLGYQAWLKWCIERVTLYFNVNTLRM